MPTYEYQCGTCGNRFEKYQSFSDEPVKICPECGNEVRKVFSAAGIIFKGSGWYINDSRKSSSSKVGGESKSETKTEATAETKSETKVESSGDTKAEAKPESKSEAKPDSKKEAAA